MKIKHFYSELEAMRAFYDELGITPNYDCNTDGRVNGTLVEIKLNSTDIPFKQLKRYINAYNSLALPIPQYSLFISFNQREFTFINNENEKIITKAKGQKTTDMLKFLNKEDYIKGWINEFSIVSYNDLFYKNNPSTKKEDFIEEVKNPKTLNIEPYNWNKTGDMERDILDCLGSTELKKRLGAFFTPDEYVKISTEYLRNAIKRVPEGHDYIILDRCAGTGNLEKFLTDEELSHCILNTYVYAEWTTLKGVYGDRVRCIIPHTKEYKDNDGLLSDGDALSEKFIKNPIIKKYINNPKCIIIMLENPPFGEPQAGAERGEKTRKNTTKDYIAIKMKEKDNIKNNVREMANKFIWSAFKYYLKTNDTYILFSPIKYWKSQHIILRKFEEGHICNRLNFHASEGGVTLIRWTNIKRKIKILPMTSDIGKINILFTKNANHSIFDNKEKDKNGIAYLFNSSFEPNYKNCSLKNYRTKPEIKASIPNRWLNKENLFKRLPLFTSNFYPHQNYTSKNIIYKSSDGGIEYQKDKNFLNDCFIWSCLSQQNKCISNDEIKNELCLCQNTEADKLLNIEQRHTTLLEKWEEILKIVKTTDEYNPNYTYGSHQIIKEINIKVETGGYTKKNKPILEHKHTELNSLIKDFKEELKIFYDKYLTPKLFEYELLK